MPEGCIHDCLACGKCRGFSILDSFDIERQRLEMREGYGIAVDIGSTSVVLALVDLAKGKIMARHSFMNPQRAYGPDVISRIDAADAGNLDAMRRLITESIVSGVDTLVKECRLAPEQICDMVVAGNTVMTYLLLGLPCESLGVFPFKPAFGLAEHYDFPGVFGAGVPACPVRIVPWMAAFVGGDITAGLLHVLTRGAGRFLLVDLGTNGEMALYNNGQLTITSTAAGPAFEGASRGGGASGVMDDLARLVREGLLDETGLLNDNAPALFSQKEIRDLQLAKSAVRSGLELLIGEAGLSYAAIDAVYLAGGIGQAMNPDSAGTIGLLPSALREKTLAVGNAALGGAVRLLVTPKQAAADRDKCLAAAVEINLAAHPRFNDAFMEYMYF